MNYIDVCPVGVDFNQCDDDQIKQFIRAWRNYQLVLTDYTQVLDSNITTRAVWATYRQELRDLPSQGSDPKAWILPVPPS